MARTKNVHPSVINKEKLVMDERIVPTVIKNVKIAQSRLERTRAGVTDKIMSNCVKELLGIVNISGRVGDVEPWNIDTGETEPKSSI
jgi:hypothetical protein